MQQAFVVIKIAVQHAGQGKILLLKRSKHAKNRPLQWDLPGGWVEEGEDFTSAAVRETREEVGIEVERNNMSLAYTLTEVTEHGNTNWLFYTCSSDTAEVVLSNEHEAYRWVTEAEALELITYERQLKALRHIINNKLLG
jgi:8-oxo-dGTP pyrophosphatase MutT (NUDIX family)